MLHYSRSIIQGIEMGHRFHSEESGSVLSFFSNSCPLIKVRHLSSANTQVLGIKSFRLQNKPSIFKTSSPLFLVSCQNDSTFPSIQNRNCTAGSQEHTVRTHLIYSKGKEESTTPMAKTSNQRTLSVYLYIPNIIGYIRILMNCVGFALCFSEKKLFAILYFISFVLDGVDGWLARKFDQVSTFGAILDMITDRVSTVCLLAILSNFYRPATLFLSLLALDVSSHWLQMYSAFLSGKASHKDVKDSGNWLLRTYYGNRLFMAYCCVGTEVLYILLFLLADNHSESLVDVLMKSMKDSLLLAFPLAMALFGCTIKQIVNVIQMKTAADVCVLHDMNKNKQP